jgi:hypothetical protein
VIGRQPRRSGRVVIPPDFLDSVVPDVQHLAQTVTCPHPVPRPHLLDGHLAAFRPHQRALGRAPVTAGTQTLHVLGRVRAEDLGFAAVGPADDRAALSGRHLRLGAVHPQPGRTGVAGRRRVAEGGGDDADPVRDRAGQARRAVDVLMDVARAGVRLAGAASRHEQPAVEAGVRRHLVRQRSPTRFGDQTRVHEQLLGCAAPQSHVRHEAIVRRSAAEVFRSRRGPAPRGRYALVGRQPSGSPGPRSKVRQSPRHGGLDAGSVARCGVRRSPFRSLKPARGAARSGYAALGIRNTCPGKMRSGS